MAAQNLSAAVNPIQEMAVVMVQRDERAAGGRGLDEFLRRNPPQFKGEFDREQAERWIQILDKNFGALRCIENDKVEYATYMLVEDAEYWWEGARQVLMHDQQAIDWNAFKGKFLEKYFPASARHEKEMEFLQLKQGGMSVAESETYFNA